MCQIETFYRRPAFSPDGSIFITPGAQYQNKVDEKPIVASLVFKRGNMSSPSLVLPVKGKPSILARFCPLLFKLPKDYKNETTTLGVNSGVMNNAMPKSKEGNQEDGMLFNLPYYMVYAVATIEAVIIYSTLSSKPWFIVANIHYAALSD